MARKSPATICPPVHPAPSTLAAADINDEHGWLRRTFSSALLLPGVNVLCAEVHQRTATSGDLGWDAELSAIGLDLSAIANDRRRKPRLS